MGPREDKEMGPGERDPDQRVLGKAGLWGHLSRLNLTLRLRLALKSRSDPWDEELEITGSENCKACGNTFHGGQTSGLYFLIFLLVGVHFPPVEQMCRCSDWLAKEQTWGFSRQFERQQSKALGRSAGWIRSVSVSRRRPSCM